MATRRRPAARKTPARPSRARKANTWSTRITPEVVRSIIGLVLLVLGAMTLIALMPRGEGGGQGTLTSWWTDVFAPWFGTMRWLLPFMLLLAGWWLEWGPGTRPGSGWGITLLGLSITYAGIVGAVQVIGLFGFTGGRVGRFLANTLTDLFSPAGAFVLCVALAILGVVIGFGIPLRQLFHPVVGTARWAGSTAAASMRRTPPDETADASAARAVAVGPGKAPRTNGTARSCQRRRRPARRGSGATTRRRSRPPSRARDRPRTRSPRHAAPRLRPRWWRRSVPRATPTT